jgi:hypothetical protein
VPEVKRRRHGLGRSEEGHRSEAVRAEGLAKSYARDAIKYAESGRCGSAFDPLVNAIQWQGIETVHGVDGRVRTEGYKAVHRATSAFSRHCIRRGA